LADIGGGLMTIKMFIFNTTNNKEYDVSNLVGNIEYTTTMDAQPGMLSFSLEPDPNGIIKIANGGRVKLWIDGNGTFLGYIVTMGTDATGIHVVTAYDQTFYLKNEVVMTTRRKSASAWFKTICKKYKFNYKVKVPSKYVVPACFHDKESLWSVLTYLIDATNTATKKNYFIQDQFGKILFTERLEYWTNLIIGEKSLLMDYQFEASIESDTANVIKLYATNKKGKVKLRTTRQSKKTQMKWGTLYYVQDVDDYKSLKDTAKNAKAAWQKEKDAAKRAEKKAVWKEAVKLMNAAKTSKIRKLASDLLKLKNRETKSVSLNINATGINKAENLTAGSSFILDLKDRVGVKQRMYVHSATHFYGKDIHLISLEVTYE